MSALTWIALIFLLGSLVVTRVMCRDFLINPIVCFFGLWTTAGLLYELDRFYGYFVLPVNFQGTLLFVLSLASFFFGAVVGLAPLRLRSRPIGIIDDSQFRVLFVVTIMVLLVFVTGVAWKVLFVTRIVGLPFAHLARIRAVANTGEFTLPLASRIMTLAGYVAALNLAVLGVFRPVLSTGIAVIGVILVSFVNDSTVGMRGSTVTTVLLFASAAVVAVGAKTGKTGLRQLLGGVGLLLAGLLLAGVILYVRSNSPISFGQRFLLDTYLAIAGQIPSTSYFLTHAWPAALPCEYTCSGLYQLVDIPLRYFFKGGVLPDTAFSPSAPIMRVHNWTFNTAAYVAYFYADARALGVGGFSLLLGYASARTFSRATTQPTFLSIQVGALMMSVVIFSIRGVLTGVVFWGCIAFMIVQQRVVDFAARSRIQPEAGREAVVEPSTGILVPAAHSHAGDTGAASKGFTSRFLRSEYLTRLLLIGTIVSLFLDMGFLSWQHASSKAPLHRAEAQIAELLRDVVAQLHATSADRHADLAIVKQVRIVLLPQSAMLAELENTGKGWRRVRAAADGSLTLPDGVVVQSWTFPTNAIEAWVYGDGVVETRAGILTLRARDGAAADVWVGPNGMVWY